MALGRRQADRVRLEAIECLYSLPDYRSWLGVERDWIGGFDFPFGLPRELIQAWGWPSDWASCITRYARTPRAVLRARFRAFCDARPAGAKFAHRATDRPAGASPSMKWVQPPVAWMLHAGVPPLLEAGVRLPGLHEPAGPDASARAGRVALEAYPGMLAREVIGRISYKADDPARQNRDRLVARERLLAALIEGRSRLGLRLEADGELLGSLCADASGDRMDATLCLIQAAWGERAGPPWYGLPADMDPLEGWIVTAPWGAGDPALSPG